MLRDIDITQDEREAYFDAFSLCETHLREEAELAAQCFSDLVRYCPDDRSAPIRAVFAEMLEPLGIQCAKDLARATKVDLVDCEQFYHNPLESDAPAKQQITKALAILAGTTRITQRSNLLGGKSIAYYFTIVGKIDATSPYQFARRALECELKCYLVGAVGELSNSDLETLCIANPVAYLHDSAKDHRKRSKRLIEVLNMPIS